MWQRREPSLIAVCRSAVGVQTTNTELCITTVVYALRTYTRAGAHALSADGGVDLHRGLSVRYSWQMAARLCFGPGSSNLPAADELSNTAMDCSATTRLLLLGPRQWRRAQGCQ